MNCFAVAASTRCCQLRMPAASQWSHNSGNPAKEGPFKAYAEFSVSVLPGPDVPSRDPGRHVTLAATVYVCKYLFKLTFMAAILAVFGHVKHSLHKGASAGSVKYFVFVSKKP